MDGAYIRADGLSGLYRGGGRSPRSEFESSRISRGLGFLQLAKWQTGEDPLLNECSAHHCAYIRDNSSSDAPLPSRNEARRGE